MKILKSILLLYLFSTGVTSCTTEELTEEPQTNLIQNVDHSNQNSDDTGDDEGTVDETEKDG